MSDLAKEVRSENPPREARQFSRKKAQKAEKIPTHKNEKNPDGSSPS
jgi:hypothetical protein